MDDARDARATDGAASAAGASEPTPEEEAARAEDFLAEQKHLRLGKLDAMRAAGVEPYPVRFDRTTTAGAIHAGVFGSHPNWSSLDPTNDNLKCTVTMGEYYATLAQWMGVSPGDVLAGNPAPLAGITL